MCIPTINHVALVEYIGTFPDHVTNQGNANTGEEYVRNKPDVMEKMHTSCNSRASKPKHIYSVMQLNAQPTPDKPHTLKQVQNMSVKEISTSQSSSKGNVAGDIQSVFWQKTLLPVRYFTHRSSYRTYYGFVVAMQ